MSSEVVMIRVPSIWVGFFIAMRVCRIGQIEGPANMVNGDTILRRCSNPALTGLCDDLVSSLARPCGTTLKGSLGFSACAAVCHRTQFLGYKCWQRIVSYYSVNLKPIHVNTASLFIVDSPKKAERFERASSKASESPSRSLYYWCILI